MVRKAILKPAIPFAVLSTTLLTTSVHKAKAMTLGQDEYLGPQSTYQWWKNIAPSFQNPFQDLQNKVTALQDNMTVLQDNMTTFFTTMNTVITFFKDMKVNIIFYTDTLLGKLYEWMIYLLQTPLFLFNSTNIRDISLIFGEYSLLIVTFLTIITGIKRMMQAKHTDFKKLLTRYFYAIIGAGTAPVLFENAFRLINTITRAVGQMGGKVARDHIDLSTTVTETATWLNVAGLAAFDIVLIAMLIPVLMQQARRFFDLLVLSSITPLALSAWIFDEHRHYFKTWWNAVKKLSLTPIIYAVFVCMMGLLIFGTTATTWSGLFIKLVLLAGGLHRMNNVPNFLRREMDSNKKDIEDEGIGAWKKMREIRDTLMFKNTKTGKFLWKKSEEKKSALIKERLKNGRRSV